jgi:hypothetical protein
MRASAYIRFSDEGLHVIAPQGLGVQSEYPQGLKWGGSRGLSSQTLKWAPTPLKWALPSMMWAPPPIKIVPLPPIIVPLFPWVPTPLNDYINSDKNYVGYCVFVSVPHMHLLCLGVQVILASRKFQLSRPRSGSSESSIADIHRQVMVIIARSA